MFPHNLILLLQASEDMNLMFSMQASENMNSVLSIMLSLLVLIGISIIIIGMIQFVMFMLREDSDFSFKGLSNIALGSCIIVMKFLVDSFIINPTQDSFSDVVSEKKINTSAVLNNVNTNSNTIPDNFWMILGVLVIVIIFAISMFFYVKYMKSKEKTKEKIEEDVLSTENIMEEKESPFDEKVEI